MEILTLVPDVVETDMNADWYEIAEVAGAEAVRAVGFAEVGWFGEVADPVEVGLPARPELLAE